MSVMCRTEEGGHQDCAMVSFGVSGLMSLLRPDIFVLFWRRWSNVLIASNFPVSVVVREAVGSVQLVTLYRTQCEYVHCSRVG